MYRDTLISVAYSRSVVVNRNLRANNDQKGFCDQKEQLRIFA